MSVFFKYEINFFCISDAMCSIIDKHAFSENSMEHFGMPFFSINSTNLGCFVNGKSSLAHMYATLNTFPGACTFSLFTSAQIHVALLIDFNKTSSWDFDSIVSLAI